MTVRLLRLFKNAMKIVHLDLPLSFSFYKMSCLSPIHTCTRIIIRKDEAILFQKG